MAIRRKTSTSRAAAGIVLPAAPGDPKNAAGDGADRGDGSGAAAPTRTATPSDLTPIKKIGEALVEAGATDTDAVEKALADADGSERLGEILVRTRVVTERDVAQALADQLQLPFVDLRRSVPESGMTGLLDEEDARTWGAIAMRRVEDAVLVVVADPTQPGVLAAMSDVVGGPVRLGVASGPDVSLFHDRTYRAVSGVDAFVKVFEAQTQVREASSNLDDRFDENAPVVQVVTMLLSQAVRDRASDVHIEPMGDRVRVRNRIDGALHEVLSLPMNMAPALASRIKIMAGLNIVERRRPQDGQIESTVDGRELDIRVSTTGTVFGEKVVLRILDRQRALYGLHDLGMPDATGTLFDSVISSPYGMVVCAGPTGSGKTTTLYATLNAIASDEINVMTVEDPVEYVFPSINQISINEQAGVTFSAGLRSILRQDPDSILVGEIRDVETARIAVQAALTGHFVMSTIHATDATSALHRFLDMGIESFLLASAMLAVVGQRLVRRVCDECRESYVPTPEELAFYRRAGGTKDDDEFVRGAGCAFCAGTGYYGRQGVYEVLRITEEMRELLVHEAQADHMRSLAIEQGMVPMRDQAIDLIDEGTTTIAEVMRAVYVM